ncbi:MAG: L-seryl-tRNA(Sec) selenium transferase, partial [Proteobacteria bacterium]|nr:L-seryl-tRNA(Sec) selenium transferase [Pseudomonadota bacterium]
MDRSEELRRIPAVDDLLRDPVVARLVEEYTRPVVVEAVRRVLDHVRQQIIEHEQGAPDPAAIVDLVQAETSRAVRPRLRRLVNATGVVVHTNLGRSVLAETAIEAVVRAARHYSNLEFDLALGKRGSRYALVEDLLTGLTGAESALVVNNNAAAVFLSLQTLAAGREVIVSRGQLVEIGGSFRIPDVMARSGATLVEVGATNKTHPYDYERAITENTALLLKVHTSNFAVIGFTAEVDLPTLVEIGGRHGLPVMEDLGSGTLVDFGPFGVGREPTVTSCLEAGVDLVTFSGDKLLGGPQAGIILGRREYLDQIKKNPLHRAVRVDKMTLAGLEATLNLYRDPRRARELVPTVRMLTRPL